MGDEVTTTQQPDKSRTVTVSIIVPVYNEYYHIEGVIDRLLRVALPGDLRKEVIVVDDGSRDGTTDLLRDLHDPQIRVLHSTTNCGKGAAIRKGLQHATGDIIVFQDGDKEYNPAELVRLVTPILDGKASVVYGSRFLGQISGMYFRYWLANKLLILAVRVLFGTWITDEATAYKAFDRRVLASIPLHCRRFEFCPEVTAKVLRRGIRIHEVPITYVARTTAQGKKIRVRDAFEAFWTLLKYRFLP
jgi:glycosyltransferase involved in cell wall biosynthesis